MKSRNSAMDNVYRSLDDLRKSVEWDTFNLTRDDQFQITLKIQELKEFINGKYGAMTE